MKISFEIERSKASPPADLQQVQDRGRWWNSVLSVIREPFTGAWQRNKELSRESILTFHAVYRCVTLIASDIAKCKICLVEKDENGIWNEAKAAAFSPVLEKPNKNQTRIKFFEQWMVSKLLSGNTYVLKQRDNRKVVTALYVLDPSRVKPLITPSGYIYYEIQKDNWSGIKSDNLVIPASEIIHDTMVPLFHPLCGVSPLTACGLAASQGLNIQSNSAKFFANGSRPGGILTAPGAISDETASRLKAHWESNFTGENVGKVAVLGDGLEYKVMSVSATDAQLIEQLKWSGETVCSSFGIPAYKAGIGQPPTQTNIQALDIQYYSQCLQTHFESIEILLDEGLGLINVQDHDYGTEFDLDGLLRMDTATLIKTLKDAGGIMAPNEQRKKLGYGPVTGGAQPMVQQQNYSLEALAKRDASSDPFAKATAALPAPSKNEDDSDDTDNEDIAKEMIEVFETELRDASYA